MGMVGAETIQGGVIGNWRAWLSRLELAWVLLLAPAILLPGALVPGEFHGRLVACLFALWPLRLLLVQRMRPAAALDVNVIALALWLPVGWWVSVERVASIEGIGYVSLGIALYFALTNWMRWARRPAWGLWLVIGAGFALLTLGFGQVAQSSDGQFSRLQAPLAAVAAMIPFGQTIGVVNINIYASIAAFLLPIFFALCLFFERRSLQSWLLPLWLIGLVGMSVILLASRSRGGLLAAAAGAAAVVWLRWPKLRYGAFALPLLIAGFVTYITPAEIAARVDRLLTAGGLSGRLEIWARARYILQDFGFTGIGFGTFGTASQALYPYGTLQGVDFHHAHNLFLQIGSDLGLPGIVAYVAVWIGAFALVLQILGAPGVSASRRAQVIGAAGAAVGLLTNGLIDIALWGVKASFLPWMLLAFVAGSSVYIREAGSRDRSAR